MGLPLVPEFAEFLGSLSLTRTSQQSIELFPEEIATDGQRYVERDHAITLWYTPTAISWHKLIERVRKELSAKRHKDSVPLAHALLGMFCLRQHKEEAPVESFNSILESIIDVGLTQFFILPQVPPPTLSRFSFGSFTLGALDLPKLESRSRRAGSDYHELYGIAHRGKFAIERGISPARIVDWKSMQLPASESLQKKKTWDRLIHGYFSALNRDYFEDFWSNFFEEQALPITLGAVYLKPEFFKFIPRTSSISIFMADTWGHVAPQFAPTVAIDFGSADKKFNKIKSDLEVEYRFKDFTASDQHRTIKSFARFVGRGKRHFADGDVDEGYLHHVIALDLVFSSGQEQISKTVSERVAVIIHKPIGTDFESAVRLLSQAYGARSKYVHEGRSINEKLIGDMDRVSREVMLCLLRLQRGNPALSVEQWLLNLDFFATAMKAGKLVAGEELRANGIAAD